MYNLSNYNNKTTQLLFDYFACNFCFVLVIKRYIIKIKNCYLRFTAFLRLA